MKYGLSEHAVQQIKDTVKHFPQVEETILYGSRAKGNYKPASDIDLTFKGSLTLQHLNQIAVMLDDLLLPQKFDISIYNQISNTDLLNHIERIGQRL